MAEQSQFEKYPDPGAQWVELAEQSHLEIVGKDRATFLNGFCTAEIKALAIGHGVEAFVTTHQGKTLGHGVVLAREDRLVFIGSPGQTEPLAAHWNRFVISEDAEFVDRRSEQAVLCLGGSAKAVLAACGVEEIPQQRLSHRSVNLAGVEVLLAAVDYWGFVPAWLIVAPRTSLPTITQHLESHGASGYTLDQFHAGRIAAGYPWHGVDFNADNLPQELARDALAINFRKGCYLGQETVARIDAMGHVNRVLCGVALAGDPPPSGTALLAEGKEVGRITSVAHSAALGRTLGLAIVKRAWAVIGKQLESAVGVAEVVRFPLAS